MARYPGEDGERRIPADRLQARVTRLFMACGMDGADAGLLAESLVQADLRGIHSHGVLRVPDYVAKLTREGVDPAGRPTLLVDSGAALVVEANNAMGQIAGRFAMDRAMARARDVGVALAAVRGSNHCGALDWYTMRAAEEGFLALAGSNALPTMAPWGGRDKIVGLNPLSVAVPAAGRPPLVLDMALGQTAHGKIRVYAQKGEPLPEGWAFDAEGRPTRDAAAALAGLIQPIGGPKGIGLAVMVGLLSTVLSGAAYGTASGTMETGAVAGVDGQFYLAIDIARFRPLADVEAQVAAIAAQFTASRRVGDVERLYLPGDLEAELAARNRRDGIPLNAGTLAAIEAEEAALGLAADGD